MSWLKKLKAWNPFKRKSKKSRKVDKPDPTEDDLPDGYAHYNSTGLHRHEVFFASTEDIQISQGSPQRYDDIYEREAMEMLEGDDTLQRSQSLGVSERLKLAARRHYWVEVGDGDVGEDDLDGGPFRQRTSTGTVLRAANTIEEEPGHHEDEYGMATGLRNRQNSAKKLFLKLKSDQTLRDEFEAIWFGEMKNKRPNTDNVTTKTINEPKLHKDNKTQVRTNAVISGIKSHLKSSSSLEIEQEYESKTRKSDCTGEMHQEDDITFQRGSAAYNSVPVRSRDTIKPMKQPHTIKDDRGRSQSAYLNELSPYTIMDREGFSPLNNPQMSLRPVKRVQPMDHSRTLRARPPSHSPICTRVQSPQDRPDPQAPVPFTEVSYPKAPGPRELARASAGRLLWRVRDFATKRHLASSGLQLMHYSPPFLSGPEGYRMCAKIYMSTVDRDAVTRDYLGIDLELLTGDYDHILHRTPFELPVNFTILDQSEQKKHVSRIIDANCSLQKIHHSEIIMIQCPDLISLDMIDGSDSKYVVDDSLMLLIKVEPFTVSDLFLRNLNPKGRDDQFV